MGNVPPLSHHRGGSLEGTLAPSAVCIYVTDEWVMDGQTDRQTQRQTQGVLSWVLLFRVYPWRCCEFRFMNIHLSAHGLVRESRSDAERFSAGGRPALARLAPTVQEGDMGWARLSHVTAGTGGTAHGLRKQRSVVQWSHPRTA